MVNVKIKKIAAFSLIEVMLSLIILSIVTAAVVPVITKKITNKSIKIEAEEKNEESDYTTDCSQLINSKMVGENCTLCNKGEGAVCKQCPMECDEGMFLDIPTCSCIPCGVPDCVTCKTTDYCFKCYASAGAAYYSDNGECKECPSGSYCNGIKATPCPKDTFSANSAISCQPCLGDEYADQGSSSCTKCKSTDAGNCACTKADDACARCKDGYNLNNGVCELSEQGD